MPVNSEEFIKNLRGQLSGAANKVDQAYLANAYFKIVDGRPTLAKLVKKPIPDGFNAIHDALNRMVEAARFLATNPEARAESIAIAEEFLPLDNEALDIAEWRESGDPEPEQWWK